MDSWSPELPSFFNQDYVYHSAQAWEPNGFLSAGSTIFPASALAPAPGPDLPSTGQLDISSSSYPRQAHDAIFLNDVQLISSSAMAPPTKTRKRKAPTLRAEDWEPHKARIIELHIVQDKPLSEVKEIIERELSFKAEIRQYRSRISQWKLDKNIKNPEMKAIVRKRQYRRLEESSKAGLNFRVRGHEVDSHKIDRFMTREGISENDSYAPSPAAPTPSALSCWTLSESSSPAPTSHILMLSPTFSIRSPPAQSPQIASPALSISSIIRSTHRPFAGQSPQLSTRVIPQSFRTPDPVQIPWNLSRDEWLARMSNPGNMIAANQSHFPPGHSPQVATVKSRYREEEADSLRQELSTLETRHGKDQPETLHALNSLGEVLLSQGRYRSAEEVFRRLLAARQKHDGDKDTSTFDALGRLGEVCFRQGFFSRATKMYGRVCEFRRDVLGEEHPATLTSMGNLASTYEAQGRWTEAEELGVRVVEMKKRVLGEEHPDTLASMGNLASTYMSQGRWMEAEELGVRVVEIRKRVLGEEHPNTLTSMGNLASTYEAQGRWTEAEELGVRVVEMRKRVLGEKHPHTLSSMGNLASTYMSQGRWMEAEELQVQVIETVKRVLGEEHPDTLTSMGNLASTYEAQGRWTEAEELGVRVVEMKKRVLGEEHPNTLTSMNNLALTWKSQGRDEQAIDLKSKCIQLLQHTLGADHPHTISLIQMLQSWQAR